MASSVPLTRTRPRRWRLLGSFWRLLVGVKDALALLLLLIFFGLLFALLSISPNPGIPNAGALLVALDGTLVEQPAEVDPFATLASSGPITTEYRLRDVVHGLNAAATDTRVKAVVLDLDRFLGGGQATIAAAADAVDRVRRAGKPVLAYATGYTDDGYQLAAHASEVWLDPYGAVLLAGPGGSQLYYKGLLDKLGVTAKVYRVGEFKSAVEPFTRSDQSPEARAANQALADTLWARWQDEVSRVRPKAQLRAYIAAPGAALARTGGDPAQAALAAGLVDRLGDRIAFGKRVAELAGPSNDRLAGGYQAIPFASWTAANPLRTTGDAIGVLTVAGEIVDGTGGPGSAAGDTIAQLLTKALAEKPLKALVVRIDSPGGSVLASERIRSAILEAKRRKLPIVVSMGSVAASGGYWIATPADRIFADPATITGSIGVFGILPTFEGSLAKLGLSADGVKTTPLSGEPDVLRGTSPEFDALLQGSIEHVYGRFMRLVGASRGLPVERVDQIGQGRVWAGATARQIGLVDQFGGLDAAIADAARRAKLDPEKVRPIYIEREPNAWKTLFRETWKEQPANDGAPADAFTRIAQRPDRLIAAALADLRRIGSGPAVQVRCIECPIDAAAARPSGVGLLRRLLERL